FNELILRYQAHLKEKNYAPATINRRIAAIRSYVSMARLLKLTTVQVHAPPLRPEPVRDVAGCGAAAYGRILVAADERRRKAQSSPTGNELAALRVFALLVLYHDAGRRRFEPLGMRYPEDVDLQSKRIRFRGKKRRTAAWFAINDRAARAIA